MSIHPYLPGSLAITLFIVLATVLYGSVGTAMPGDAGPDGAIVITATP